MNDHNPDWGRVGARAPDHFSALGDPTRWGASVKQAIPVAPLTINGQLPGQVLSVQCRDGYSRAWTMAGVVRAPRGYFNLADDATAADGWTIAAYVSMGVGQVQIVHNFNIRAIIDADSPYYWNSDISNPFGVGLALDTPVSLPFIIPGALIGNALNVQFIQRLAISTPFPAGEVQITAIVNPFDPGAKK